MTGSVPFAERRDGRRGTGAPQVAVVVAVLGWAAVGPAAAQSLAVTSGTTGRVVLLDVGTGEELRSFDIGTAPHELVVRPGAAVAWAPSQSGGGVMEIDLLTGEVRTLDVGSNALLDIAPDRSGGRLWAASETDSTVLEIDAVSGRILRSIHHGLAMGHGIDASPDGSVLWVPDRGSGDLARIDVRTGSVRRIPLGASAEDVAVAPGDGEVWVTLVPSGEVVVLDAEGVELERLDSGGDAPMRIRMEPDGSRVWVANNGLGVVSVFDRASRTREADIDVGTRPLGIAFDEAGGLAYVTRPGAAEIVEIDAETFDVLRRLPGPPSPDGVAWIPRHPIPRSVVRFGGPDGAPVFADLHRAPARPVRALLLLLHQGGGSGRAEYRNVIPRLLDAGFDALAVDLPGGGDRFGGLNRTVRAAERPWTGYCGDYPTAAAALDRALDLAEGAPVVVIGSSYTGALALQLAGRRTSDLAGVAAFSPASGEPLADCYGPGFTAGVELPIFVVRPESEAERPVVQHDLATLERQGHRTWIARPGTHGASMLDPARVENSEETWRMLDEWLRAAVPTPIRPTPPLRTWPSAPEEWRRSSLPRQNSERPRVELGSGPPGPSERS